MILPYYEKENNKLRKLGTLSITNKILVSKKTSESLSSIDLINETFFYRYRSGRDKLSEVITPTSIYKVKISRLSRWQLAMMFANHWYYNNKFTQFKIKYASKIYKGSQFAFIGLTFFKLIKSIIALIIIFKACN